MGDPKFREKVQPLNRRIEGARRSERPNMHLVMDRACERRRLPSFIRPREGAVIVHTRHAMYTLGLPQTPRIGEHRRIVIQHKPVIRTRPRIFYLRAPPALVVRTMHRVQCISHLYLQPVRRRSPYRKFMHCCSASLVGLAPAALPETPAAHPPSRTARPAHAPP